MTNLDELKRQIDLRVFVAGLLSKGTHHFAYDQYRCPLPGHMDDSPSFTVWNDHFYCFGCEIGGSILDFIMHYESCSLKEAATKLEERQGIHEYTPPKQLPPEKRRVIPMQIVEENHLHIQLGLSYFEQRQITDNTAFSQKLGVKPQFRSQYTFSDEETIVSFESPRYAIPNLFDGKVRAINYRRNDPAFLNVFNQHANHQAILEDLSKVLKRDPTKEDILKYCAGPKYKQEYGSTWKPFNVGIIKERSGDTIQDIFRPYILLHAETKEFDTLALCDLGMPTVGVHLNEELVTVLPSLFVHIPLIYIIRDNDDPGLDKAIKLQQCLGRGRIISPPKGYKDSGEVAMDGMALRWFDGLGLKPILKGY